MGFLLPHVFGSQCSKGTKLSCGGYFGLRRAVRPLFPPPEQSAPQSKAMAAVLPARLTNLATLGAKEMIDYDESLMNSLHSMSNNAPMISSPGSTAPKLEAEQRRVKRQMLQCQSTPEGDVRTFIEPHVRADERQLSSRTAEARAAKDGTRDDSKPSPEEKSEVAVADGLGAFNGTQQSQHLSAHFYDAAKISDDAANPGLDNNSQGKENTLQENQPVHQSDLTGDQQAKLTSDGAAQQPEQTSDTVIKEAYAAMRRSPVADYSAHVGVVGTVCDPSPSTALIAGQLLPSPTRSPFVGQKHRRGQSFGSSNPNVAHRRMNSGGIVAPVDRRDSGNSCSYEESQRQARGPIPQLGSQMPPPTADGKNGTGHQRENSAGLSLSMLTAAANASKDVLAEAAGARRASPPSLGRRASPFLTSGSVSFSSVTTASTSVDYQTKLQQPQLYGPSGSAPSNTEGNTAGHDRTDHSYPPPPAHSGFQHYQGGVSQPPPPPPPQASPQVLYPPHPSAQQPYYPPPTQSGCYYPPPRSSSSVTPPAGPPPPQPTYYPPPRSTSSAPSSGPPPPYPVQYAPPGGGGNYAPLHGARKPSPPPPPGSAGYYSHRMPAPESQDAVRQTQPSHGRQYSQASTVSAERINTDEPLFTNKDATQPPVRWADRQGGAPGTETYASEGNRQVLTHPGQPGTGNSASALASERGSPVVSSVQQPHQRVESSVSSLGVANTFYPEAESAKGPAPARGPVAAPHHRKQSSANSFLQTLTELETSDNFLQQLSTTNPSPTYQATGPKGAAQFVPPPSAPNMTPQTSQVGAQVIETQPTSSTAVAQSATPTGKADVGTSRSYMTSGSGKRVRRKCTVANCPNRVVQGGLCIAHGAKRKQCSYPGCTKNVKKAGLCSTHGPARKKCDFPLCNKVAVQGGVCIAHGARKKLCLVEDCTKQAILSGMCKKHHDQHHGIVSGRGARRQSNAGCVSSSKPPMCVVIGGQSKVTPTQEDPEQKPNHQRGLSLFQEMSAVATIIGEESLAEAGVPLAPPVAPQAAVRVEVPPAGAVGVDQSFPQEMRQPNSGDIGSVPPPPREDQQKKPKKAHRRGLSFFTDETVADTIINKNII